MKKKFDHDESAGKIAANTNFLLSVADVEDNPRRKNTPGI